MSANERMYVMRKLLDLFCGAGGASMGYARAGFVVTGVDLAPQPRYPFAFVQADALDYLMAHGHEYDLIHASPPCQAYLRMHGMPHARQYQGSVPVVRQALEATGCPYILENIPGAPLRDALMLCGTMFAGLQVIRHRLFECRPTLVFPPATCGHTYRTRLPGTRPIPATDYAQVVGHFTDVAFARKAMGIDWMSRDELAQAIPPAYTAYLGTQMRMRVTQIDMTHAQGVYSCPHPPPHGTDIPCLSPVLPVQTP